LRSENCINQTRVCFKLILDDIVEGFEEQVHQTTHALARKKHSRIRQPLEKFHETYRCVQPDPLYEWRCVRECGEQALAHGRKVLRIPCGVCASVEDHAVRDDCEEVEVGEWDRAREREVRGEARSYDRLVQRHCKVAFTAQ